MRSSPCPSSRKPARGSGALAPRRCPASPPSASRGDEQRSSLDCAQQTFISLMKDGKPTRAGWESSRLAPLAPQIKTGATKTRERRKRNVSKTTMGFQSCDPSSEPQNPRALASSARRSMQRRWERARALPGGRWTGERECVCARVCRCERGFLGMCMRGGMC